jgi:hypothetical protein
MKAVKQIKSTFSTDLYLNDVLICKLFKISKNSGYDRNDKYRVSMYDNSFKISFPFESCKSIKEVVIFLSK